MLREPVVALPGGLPRIVSTMGSLIYLSIVAAVASGQRTLILTNKALEAVEAAKDLARQR